MYVYTHIIFSCTVFVNNYFLVTDCTVVKAPQTQALFDFVFLTDRRLALLFLTFLYFLLDRYPMNYHPCGRC